MLGGRHPGGARAMWWCLLLVVPLFGPASASSGDRAPEFSRCLITCNTTGCLESIGNEGRASVCIPGCYGGGGGGEGGEGKRLVDGSLELKLLQWDCEAECKYRCMEEREQEKRASGLGEEKYFGKWPFTRVLGLQEPASVAFSVLNLLVHARGLLGFRTLVYNKLPLRAVGAEGAVYEYAGLWTLYGICSINSWLWSAIFHARDVPVTETLDYVSAIVLLGFALVVAIIRTSSIRLEAARVMVSAPLMAFTATHVLYMTQYDFDYGLNMKVCLVMGLLQLLLWAVWAGLSRHPARLTVWAVVVGTVAATSLEVYDFPPMWGVLDAHALWHLATPFLGLGWWSFVCADARWRTEALLQAQRKAAAAATPVKRNDDVKKTK